ncbi:hypothetical protein BGZ60DRAFT_424568 [Tricladium varicosporioides]|nr:hypothetical protein BGZ60DRAFT_424568 [Hymenoscyphus varicosporioides]
MTYTPVCPLRHSQYRLHCPTPPTFQARDGGRLTRPHTTAFTTGLTLFEMIIMGFALLVVLSLLGWIAYILVQNCRDYLDNKPTFSGRVRNNTQKVDKAERRAAHITKRLVLGFIGIAKVGLLAERDGKNGNRDDRRAGERTKLFDNRYGYVETRGQRSKFDGNESECSESLMRAPVMHRISCDGMCGAEAARRRSQG